MQYDGSVIIDTGISTDGIEEGFRRLKNEVGSVGDAAKRSGEKVSAAFSGAKINKTLENARHRVEQLQEQFDNLSAEHNFAIADGDDKSAAKICAQRERVYDRLAEARRRLTLEVAKAAEKEAEAEARAMEKKEKAATKPLRRFNSRMRELITGALFFNLVSSGLTKMMRYFGTALKSSDAFSASLGRLKGALLTAFQPIYEAALPALISLMNVLTAVINAVGRFFAAISGKSYKQMQENAEALKNQADGIDAVGGAAKKAQRDLAGFDEINKLSSPDAGGGGGGSAGEIAADFSDGETIANLDHILYLVGAIGAALLTWKISSMFTESLKISSGLALTIGGAFLYVFNWADAFANGIDWNNLTGMLLGMAGVVGGLWFAFGKTSGAIGLLITSIGLVIVAIKDWIETGELGWEACIALVGGIMGIGAALSLITKGPIPAIIAAVVGFAIACATNGDKIKEILQNVDDFLQGVFARDWRETFGPVLGSILNSFFDGVKVVWDRVKQVFTGFVDFFQGVFTGNWDQALHGLLDIANVIFRLLGDVMFAPFDALGKLVYNIAEKMVPDSWKNGINSVISVANRFINWLNDSLSFTIPPIDIAGKQIFSGGSLQLIDIPNIPYLAKGAVIPPNAPFMAVLGDQRNGTNIEAPLSTIQEAVAIVMEDMLQGQMAGFEAVVEVLREILEAIYGIEIGDEVISKAARRYQQKLALAKGR